MRLLNTGTLQLESLNPKEVRYAILSHTWGKDELLFADIVNLERFKRLSRENTLGYQKVSGACKWARDQRIKYVWIDTCCIDKSSSAELSEAINSMFKWYEEAMICFAYLSDVPRSLKSAVDRLRWSRWFTRGWTLQELLAPPDVVFLDSTWETIGYRGSLTSEISGLTDINEIYLQKWNSPGSRGRIIGLEPVATRMRWAACQENPARRYSLLSDGNLRCEYASVIW